MSMRLTKFQLASLLFTHGTANLPLPDGRVGIVQSVTRESGCGRSFLVEVLVGRGREDVLVTTVD
jgi:hypothetical protein